MPRRLHRRARNAVGTVFGGAEQTTCMRNLYLHGTTPLPPWISTKYTRRASCLRFLHHIACRIIEGAKTSLTNPIRHLPRIAIAIALALGVIFPCTFPVRPRPPTTSPQPSAEPLDSTSHYIQTPLSIHHYICLLSGTSTLRSSSAQPLPSHSRA